MGLMSALNTSVSALHVNTIGLQVVSNNIANVNTPGYATQELLHYSGPTYQQGRMTLGTGVLAQGIVQSGNEFLDNQLRDAISDAEGSEIQSQVYQQLEGVLGELGTNDLSTYLSNFFNALNEVANQPESASVRNLAVQQGSALTTKINTTHAQVRTIQSNINTEISNSTDRINELLGEVSLLNKRITSLEGGQANSGGAAPLRDTRRTAIKELSSLMDIKVTELENGSVNISASTGESLLFNGEVSRLVAVNDSSSGFPRTEVVIQGTGRRIDFQSGRIGGLQNARDVVVEDFLTDLTALSDNLTFQFNKLHSSGQGLTGLVSVSAENTVSDIDAPLDQTSLKFSPENGSLKVHVRDQTTGKIKTTDVFINLGQNGGTSLQDLTDQLNTIDGITAAIDYQGRLSIQSSSSNAEFYFSEDTSGTLAALGVNTFFTGSSPETISIRQGLIDNPALLAASKGGVSNDADNVISLIGLESLEQINLNGRSLRSHYETLVGSVAQKAAVTRDLADGFRQYADSVEGQSMSLVGVNLDEEAVKMLQYQRAYEASARVIQTVNDLFDVLVNL